MDYLEIAREHLRRQSSSRITDSEPRGLGFGGVVENALKGQAVLVVLDADGSRCWIVADEDDARSLNDVGSDSVFTRDELHILAEIRDPEIRAELMAFKKTLPGRLRRSS